MSFILDEIPNLDNINTSINDNLIQHKKTFTSSKISNSFNKFFETKSHFSNKISNYNNNNNINPLKEMSKTVNNLNKINPKRNSSYLKTFGKNKFNFDKILNFNFGSKKTVQLKCINTSILTTPEKKNSIHKSVKIKAKKSLFNKKSGIYQSKNIFGNKYYKNFNFFYLFHFYNHFLIYF